MSTLGAGTATRTPEASAPRRARYLSGLLWHAGAGAFLIINAFFWLLDFGLNYGGPHWAYWITLVWGFALALHALAYYVGGSRLEERKAEQYLAAMNRRTADKEAADGVTVGESTSEPTDRE